MLPPDLLDGLVDLVESDVEVELLLLERRPLLVVQLHKVLDEVEEVPGRDGHDALAAAGGAPVDG